jgi:hypothetical protein
MALAGLLRAPRTLDVRAGSLLLVIGGRDSPVTVFSFLCYGLVAFVRALFFLGCRRGGVDETKRSSARAVSESSLSVEQPSPFFLIANNGSSDESNGLFSRRHK